MDRGIRRERPPRVIAGRRPGRGTGPHPDEEPRPEKGVTRRDLLVAGIGVAAGVVTTGVTNVVVERLGPGVASSNLEAFPIITWSPDGSWLFYADEPIDLSGQSTAFRDENGNFLSEKAIEYLVDRGCVRCSPLVVDLHLSRPGDAPAVVRDIRLANHRRTAPPSGASYYSETAGANPNTVLAVDLDAPSPVAVESDYSELLSLDPDLSGRPAAFSTLTFSVEPHLTETITIGFLTKEGRHDFQLRLDYVVEGREHSIVVPEDADLLRVTEQLQARKRYEMPWYDNVYEYVETG